MGDQSTSEWADFHAFGPYHLDPQLEYAVGGVAAVIAVAALAALGLGMLRKSFDRRAWLIIAIVAAAGALGAASWRFATASVIGANIGGGALAFMAPPMIAVLLFSAVRLAVAHRWPQPLRYARILTLAAVMSAPALFATEMALSWYDRSVGVVNVRQYADVHIGETRSAVHKALGRPGSDTYWFFAPVTPATSCVYYTESNAGTSPDTLQFQLCFRGDVLVSKKASNQIYAK
jgi:hypothetical protein